MERFYQYVLVSIMMVCTSQLMGCASHQKQSEIESNTETPSDPFEPFNRKVFAFNDTLDGWVLKPVAKGYHYITPDPVERGVGNFFFNLWEVPSALNNVLQWKWKKAGSNTGRFLLNSTIGLVGLFDVAKYTGLAKQDHESFGQTLSYWGVGSGPYLVLPLRGPSTVTDTFAEPVDWVVDPIYGLGDKDFRYSLRALRVVHDRSRLLSAEELVSGDRYSFIRDAFLQRREYLVEDGELEDDFGGEFDEFEDF